jgi:hypothetical protein
MLVGEHKGMMVQEAKPLLRATLVADGRACLYSEPEKKVMSRSGEECVVALTDQWYTTPRYEAVANRNVWVCRGGGGRKGSLDEGQIPNVRGVRAALGTGCVETNRRASRNGRARSPPRNP